MPEKRFEKQPLPSSERPRVVEHEIFRKPTPEAPRFPHKEITKEPKDNISSIQKELKELESHELVVPVEVFKKITETPVIPDEKAESDESGRWNDELKKKDQKRRGVWQGLKDQAKVQGAILGAVGLMALALTPKQRWSIREERDEGKCQAPGEHNCGGKGLQVHHISPQRWEQDIAIPEDVRDRPENLITLCENFHCKEVHPDVAHAKKNYGEDRNSFSKTFAARNKLVDKREPYWNTEYDAEMFKIARKRTGTAIEKGWEYPDKPKKKGE